MARTPVQGQSLSVGSPLSIGISHHRPGIDMFSTAVNTVAVRKRKNQKRWMLKPKAVKQPVSGAKSLAVPPTRASA